jgi:hypothetical protein
VRISPEEAVEQFRAYIERHRDPDLAKKLSPVTWSTPL